MIKRTRGANKMQRIKIVLICMAAPFIISGLLNPIGLIGGSVAEAYGLSVTAAVARFGFFTGGAFVGYVLSFFVYDYFKVKSVIVSNYLLVIAAIVCLYYFQNLLVLTLSLFVVGVAISTQICGASSLVGWTWAGRTRQSMLIAQDAMFNAGGIIFSATTTAFLSRGMHWGSTYLLVAGLALLAAILAVVTRIEQHDAQGNEVGTETSWNIGILVVGICVLFFMVAKISIFIWVPQYLEQTFNADIVQGGRMMQNIFVGALAGSLVGTFVVSRIRIDVFLIAMLLIGATGMWLMLGATDIGAAQSLGYVIGASVGATFNGYLGFGLSFVRTPSHKNVAYILLAGGIGSTIAPLFSSAIVEQSENVESALYACLGIQLAVVVAVMLLAFFVKRDITLDDQHG